MNYKYWLEILISILSGLVICIPLVTSLIKKTEIAVKEKNWNKIVDAVLSYMVEAEELFVKGSEKKEYVMMAIENTAEAINFVYDDYAKQKVADMIDSICEAAKGIN